MQEPITNGRSHAMVPKSPPRKTTLTRSKSASCHSATASMDARFKRYILRRVGTTGAALVEIGRHLAMSGISAEANAWMIDSF